MLPKLERARFPKLPVDHPIDLTPPVGIPEPEPEETLVAADAEMRSGHRAIRRASDPFARRLRRKLEAGPQRPEKHERAESESVPSADRPPFPPARTPSDSTTIQAGDQLARRARKLRRKKE